MAKAPLVNDAWMHDVYITNIETGKVNYEYDGRSFVANNGVIWYTLNGRPNVYPWQIRKDTNLNLADLQVGKRYKIFRKAINTGFRTGYDWAKVVPLDVTPQPALTKHEANVLDQDLFTSPTTLRDDVAAMIEVVVQQDMTEEMLALMELLCACMDDGRITFRDDK